MKLCKRIPRLSVLLLAGLLLLSFGCSGKKKDGGSITLQGSGASFPDNIYQAWFAEYQKKHDDVRVNYQKSASGAGIAAFSKGSVDFAGSDAVTDKDLKDIKDNLITLPMTAGSIVLAFNLKDKDGNQVKELKLSRKAYTGIFRGKITKWDDDEIAKENKGVKLPGTTIAVVHRQESSGTTFNFTNHMGAISPEFKSEIGVGKTVDWPKGEGVKFSAARENAGVMNQVKNSPGSIGYIEYGYATENDLNMATLQNKAGKWVAPTEKSGQAALASKTMPDNFRVSIPDPEGDDSYPIVTYTWVLVKAKYSEDDAKKAEKLKEVLKYCLSEEAQKMAPDKGYIPLPKSVTEKVIKAVDSIKP
jgi:phosphate transport system substrate-binding protein